MSARARAAGVAQGPRDGVMAGLLLAAVSAATAVRFLAGAPRPAQSVPAAALCSAMLLAAGLAVWRPAGPGHWWRDAGIGAGGAALLLMAWLTAVPHLPLSAGQHLGALLWWTPLVTLVAVSEEVALRGALYSVLARRGGTGAAIVVSSVAFALMHVPLYGWQAAPLDLAAGLVLGGLRFLTGGVLAPAVAHAVTDIAAGWLG